MQEHLYYIEYEVYCGNEYYSRHYYTKMYDITLQQANFYKQKMVDDNETHYVFINIGRM